MSPVRALLRLSLVWGRAEGEAIHSKQLPNTGTALTSLLGGSSGRCFAAKRHKSKAALNTKNTQRQRAVAFQVGSFGLAENVPGHITLAWAVQLRTRSCSVVRVESEGNLKMAAALLSEMSHPHGDPNTGAPARLHTHGDQGCALANTGIKLDP